MPVSIIIPVLNEASMLPRCLAALQALRRQGHEIIVVDGGSEDETVEMAMKRADRVVMCERGRARQMNTGARLARGDVFLFLHTDTGLPERAVELIRAALRETEKGWGRFDVRLSGAPFLLRLVETGMNWRSRLTGIATGDQAMFVRRDVFWQVGGFADIPLMEDVELSRRLKARAAPVCLRQRVITSSRRWEEKGILRTIGLMWSLRLVYFLGVSPARLAGIYYPAHKTE